MGLRLHEFYDMPFNELLIAILSYEDREEQREYEMKFLAWYAMAGSHMDPKKIPTFDKFTQKLKTSKSRMTENQRQRMIAATREYELKKKSKK